MRWRRAGVVCITFMILAVWLAAAIEAATTIRIAHRWGPDSHFAWGLESAAEGFQRRFPDIRVEILYGYNDDKYKLETVGGNPPDVIFVAPPGLLSWAVDGLLEPLESLAKTSKVSAADFFPAAWPQVVWQGRVWAMPLQVDPNFALIWNRTLFAEAGLDPDAGPRTLADFEASFRRLTRVQGDQSLRSIGMVPWEVYGGANTVYTWGWIFGGHFYDSAEHRVTADNPRNVNALTYLRDYYQRYSGSLAPLNQGLPAGRNRFTASREAMRFSVTGDLFDYLTRFPDLDIGIGKMFYHPEGGVENPAWLGGWALSIPKGAKHLDAAWKLVHYLTADPEGTSLFGEASGWMPYYLRSPVFRTYFAKNAYWRVYLDIATTAAHYRPAMPVSDAYARELEGALQAVLPGRLQPRDGLEQATRRVQIELDRVLAGAKR